MNAADYFILALIAFAMFLAVRWAIRRKSSGACCGGSDCAGCSVRENCTEQAKEK